MKARLMITHKYTVIKNKRGNQKNERCRIRLGRNEARTQWCVPQGQPEASWPLCQRIQMAFEGNVKHHSLERLDSLVDTIAGKRMT
jgi:hypothetical protein